MCRLFFCAQNCYTTAASMRPSDFKKILQYNHRGHKSGEAVRHPLSRSPLLCGGNHMEYINRLRNCGLGLQEAEYICCYMTIYESEEKLEQIVTLIEMLKKSHEFCLV